MKRKVLTEVLNCEREGTAVSDAGRKGVPDKGFTVDKRFRSLHKLYLHTDCTTLRESG